MNWLATCLEDAFSQQELASFLERHYSSKDLPEVVGSQGAYATQVATYLGRQGAIDATLYLRLLQSRPRRRDALRDAFVQGNVDIADVDEAFQAGTTVPETGSAPPSGLAWPGPPIALLLGALAGAAIPTLTALFYGLNGPNLETVHSELWHATKKPADEFSTFLSRLGQQVHELARELDKPITSPQAETKQLPVFRDFCLYEPNSELPCCEYDPWANGPCDGRTKVAPPSHLGLVPYPHSKADVSFAYPVVKVPDAAKAWSDLSSSEKDRVRGLWPAVGEKVLALRNFGGKEDQDNPDLPLRVGQLLKNRGDTAREKLIRRLAAAHHGGPIAWVYIGFEDGMMYQYPGNCDYPSCYDPTEREWYNRALAGSGSVTWMEPYLDAQDEEIIVITPASSFVTTESTKGVKGVVGVDVAAWHLDEWLEVFTKRYSVDAAMLVDVSPIQSTDIEPKYRIIAGSQELSDVLIETPSQPDNCTELLISRCNTAEDARAQPAVRVIDEALKDTPTVLESRTSGRRWAVAARKLYGPHAPNWALVFAKEIPPSFLGLGEYCPAPLCGVAPAR